MGARDEIRKPHDRLRSRRHYLHRRSAHLGAYLMIDLCEFMDRDPEEVRSILDELLSQHEMQIALRPINYQEGFAS